jgi:hypothetical protein
MADKESFISWGRNLASMIKEAELWDDIYVALSMHLVLSEIFRALVEQKLITPDEARELGIHPDDVAQALSATNTFSGSAKVIPIRAF